MTRNGGGGNDNSMSDVAKIMSAIEGVVRILGPLESEDRHRVIQGVFVVLGETPLKQVQVNLDPVAESSPNLEAEAVSAKAGVWMRQNGISHEQLSHVFDLSGSSAVLISSDVPGKSNGEKTIKAYILVGIANFLSTGEPAFTDQSARDICENLGCYDRANHARSLKDKANNFVGDKDKGWRLTVPGLKLGAAIVKGLAGEGNA